MKTELDYLEQGSGDAVLLLHSSVAGNKQWRKLIDELSPHFKVIAPNLIGYGSTPHWTKKRLQTLNDQVGLLDVVFQRYEKLSIVGHSFGGSVAMMAAKNYPKKVKDLICYLAKINSFIFCARIVIGKLLMKRWHCGIILKPLVILTLLGNSGSLFCRLLERRWVACQGMDEQRQDKVNYSAQT